MPHKTSPHSPSHKKSSQTKTAMGGGFHSLVNALNFKDLNADGGSVTATLPADANFSQTAHMGLAPSILTTALDTLLGLSVYSKFQKPVPIATIDLSTDFMALLDEGVDAKIRTSCDFISDNVAFVSGTVLSADTSQPIARGNAKFIIKSKRPNHAPELSSKTPEATQADSDAPYQMEDASVNPLFESAKQNHPFATWLGAHLMQTRSGAIMHLPFSDMIIGDPVIRAVHGGMLASLMEMAAAGAIITKTGIPDLPAPLSSTVNYLKRTTATDCFASANIIRFGRNIIVIHARCWQQAPEIPVASATFLFKGLPS